MVESNKDIEGVSHGIHPSDHCSNLETQLRMNSFAGKEHHSSLLVLVVFSVEQLRKARKLFCW